MSTNSSAVQFWLSGSAASSLSTGGCGPEEIALRAWLSTLGRLPYWSWPQLVSGLVLTKVLQVWFIKEYLPRGPLSIP